MFNSNHIVIEAFVDKIKKNYSDSFGLLQPEYPNIVAFVTRLVLENLANCDAPYHNLEHTILVTDVGMDILRGKHISDGKLEPKDWLHCILALLCHDIGYLRGVLKGDGNNQYIINENGDKVELARGCTDAALLQYHVDRSKVFVKEWFSDKPLVDENIVIECIEMTRFPIPDNDWYKETDTFPGLVRAADLIGQMGDPHYLRKSSALYQEFVESGTAEVLGYKSPADLRENFPKFFWSIVKPLLNPAIFFLKKTQSGKQWVSSLYSHVFTEEHTLATSNLD